MDSAGLWTMGVGAALVSFSYMVYRSARTALPAFLISEWNTAQIYDALGPLEAAQVRDVFVRDMERRGADARAQLARLPPPGERHHVAALALCSQIGLAFMYSWLARQFAPFGLVPCHDSFTHKVSISPEAIRHTLRYRLQHAHGRNENTSDEVWKVDFMVRLCAHRQVPLHAKVIAAPRIIT